MSARKQTARISIDWRPSTEPPVVRDLEVTTANVRSRVSNAVKELLTGYVTSEGATITITLDPAELDEYANPER